MRKVALLIGINYRQSSNELAGCINDIENTRTFLENRGFQVDVLTDDSHIKPTRKNILKRLFDITASTHRLQVDHLWLSYSGHGSYLADNNADELDGKDETIVPLDYSSNGMIRDDDIHLALTQIHPNTKTTILWDCCHSGTGADLPFRYTNHVITENQSRTVLAPVTMISGCRDQQYSAESWNGTQIVGAMTSLFLQEYRDGITYDNLLTKMRQALNTFGYDQEPQLTSSRIMNVHSPFTV